MIKFNRKAPNGNIFFILAAAVRILTEKSASEEMCERVYRCHSYDEALAVIGEYVILIEEV